MKRHFSDNELLELLSVADSEAFAFVYQKHFSMVSYFVRKNSGSDADAKDLFQEVLIIIYEKLRDKKLKLSCTLKTYIYSVARNQWLKKLKQAGQKIPLANFEDFITIEENENPREININFSLKEIGEACRKLLVLFYYRKKSMEEISVQLEYANADTVKNQKYKCIQRLKKLVENQNHGTQA